MNYLQNNELSCSRAIHFDVDEETQIFFPAAAMTNKHISAFDMSAALISLAKCFTSIIRIDFTVALVSTNLNDFADTKIFTHECSE